MPTCSRSSSKAEQKQHDSDPPVRLYLAYVPAAFRARSDSIATFFAKLGLFDHLVFTAGR
jgi:hypothetical protein